MIKSIKDRIRLELEGIASANFGERCAIIGMSIVCTVGVIAMLIKWSMHSPISLLIVMVFVGIVVFVSHTLPTWVGTDD